MLEDDEFHRVLNNDIDCVIGLDTPIPKGIESQMCTHCQIRNNIIRGTNMCSLRVGLYESSPGADPRIVENNDFFDHPTALYMNEGSTALSCSWVT